MRSAINISYITMYKEYKVVDDICLLDRLRFAVLVTGEFLIFSSGEFHNFAVSCVSYPWSYTYNYRVSCKESVLYRSAHFK